MSTNRTNPAITACSQGFYTNYTPWRARTTKIVSMAMGSADLRRGEPFELAATGPDDRIGSRLGLTVPHEWWPSPPLIKSFEAAGFGLVQVDAPPIAVLSDARLCTMHATAVRTSLETTGLASVLHAPSGLRAGSAAGDRGFAGLLDYAAELGARFVVYHALSLPNAGSSEAALKAELRALKAFARYAASVGTTIAIENLAPYFPGPETVSASPMALRSLVRKLGSEGLGLCLDIGHAYITADLRQTDLRRLVEPVLDQVVLFHAHDNLGGRRRGGAELLGVDPLRLDLHLPPGRGNLPWAQVADLLRGHSAPIVYEIHPPYRPKAGEIFDAASRSLSPNGRPA